MAGGGSEEGILGWNRRAISAYTWCITEKGPQRRWLHKIKNADTPECDCHQEHSGEHLVEGCGLLAEAQESVEKEEIREWGTRHTRDKKKKKGDVGIEKEEGKEEGERLEGFFGAIYNFLVPAAPAASDNHVPVELPARFVPVAFVPAMTPVTNFLGLLFLLRFHPLLLLLLLLLPLRLIIPLFLLRISFLSRLLLVLAQTTSYVL